MIFQEPMTSLKILVIYILGETRFQANMLEYYKNDTQGLQSCEPLLMAGIDSYAMSVDQ